jgi:hypothetical protein
MVEEETNALTTLAMDLPFHIEEEERNISDLIMRLEEKREELEGKDLDIVSSVLNEVGEDGRLLFSNETARKTEIRRRQRENEEYRRLSDEIRLMEYEKRSYEISAKRKSRLHKSVIAIIQSLPK